MSGPEWLPRAFSSAGPSFSVLGNSLLAVWKGPGSDNRIWWSKTTFSNWESWTTAAWSNAEPFSQANFDTTLAPCLTEAVTYADGSAAVSLIWRSAKDKSIWYATYDGKNWTAAAALPGALSDAAPAASYYQRNLVATWRGEGTDQKIYYAVLSAANAGAVRLIPTWSKPEAIPGTGTSDAPALAAAASALYLFWKGEGTDPRILYSTYDGKTWGAQQVVPGVGTSLGPVARAAMLGPVPTDIVWLAWKGEANDTRVFYSSLGANKQWAAQQALPVGATQARPALACYDDVVFTAWDDAAGSAILWGALLRISAPVPPSAAVATMSFNPTWSTSGGNTIGGRVTLTVRSDGTWTVQFDTWNGPGLPTYNYQVRAYLIGPDVPVLMFSHSDHIGNDLTKKVNESYSESGSNPLIALHWSAIQNASTTFQVKTDFEISGVLGAVEKVLSDLVDFGIGAAGAAIGVVIGLTKDALGALHVTLGPGTTIGVIAGAAVFVIGAVVGLPIGATLIIGTAAGAATGAVANALIQSRPMTADEIRLAKEVFQTELNYANVMFTNFSTNGRSMTAPGVDGKTYCNFGSSFRPDMATMFDGSYPVPGELMIHELTHAWQIQHNSFIPGFVCSGMINQANYQFADDIYRYGPPGLAWNSLNLEQQASIVNEWFAGKGDTADPGYPAPQAGFTSMDQNNPYSMYIRNNILTGSGGYSTSVLSDGIAVA